MFEIPSTDSRGIPFLDEPSEQSSSATGSGGRGAPFDMLRDRGGEAQGPHRTRYSLLGRAKRAELERDKLRDRWGISRSTRW